MMTQLLLEHKARKRSEHTLFLMRIFDVVTPMLTSAGAILLVASYGITEERAYSIRTEIDARRKVDS